MGLEAPAQGTAAGGPMVSVVARLIRKCLQGALQRETGPVILLMPRAFQLKAFSGAVPPCSAER